jgi:hypothetical protein
MEDDDDGFVSTKKYLHELSDAERSQILRELAEARAAGQMPPIQGSIFTRPKIFPKLRSQK